MNELQPVNPSLPELPLDPPDQQPSSTWCLACGQEYIPTEHDVFCSECLACPDFEIFANRSAELAEEVKNLEAGIDALKQQVRARLTEPSTLYRQGLEVAWRRYPRSKLDIKRFRREQPTVYDNYATMETVDAIYISRVDTD